MCVDIVYIYIYIYMDMHVCKSILFSNTDLFDANFSCTLPRTLHCNNLFSNLLVLLLIFFDVMMHAVLLRR